MRTFTVAATHHDLAQLVEERLVRDDLDARLDGFKLDLPLLRERRRSDPNSIARDPKLHLNFTAPSGTVLPIRNEVAPQGLIDK